LGNFGLLALYVLGFIAIFYFLAIRPQQRQRKAHDLLVSGLKRGDRVVTIGGLHGKIKRTEDDMVVVEIAKNVDVRMGRRAISEVVTTAETTSTFGQIDSADEGASED